MAGDGHIFIFALLGRSGTNYLANLLDLHPDCTLAAAPLLEDWFLADAQKLSDYAEALEQRYSERSYPNAADFNLRVARALGAGLLTLLTDGRDGLRVISKTPSTMGLDRFAQFFPTCRPVILLRDGRSVVASYMASFEADFDNVVHWWRQGAVRHLAAREAGQDVHEVRYETLYREPQRVMAELLEYLQLSPEAYPFERCDHLAVVGSSSFGRGTGAVHWHPVPRTDDFDPTARHADWSSEQHRRFNAIAGEELARLGYAPC